MNQTHPLGARAKILLTSVFGPFAQDDEYGSRTINPMELYHNQVTRVQGAFSLRMFHRSFGLILIQENIEAPCTLLDFPDLERFIQEIGSQSYDIVGISGIVPNIGKVQKMCALVRQFLPRATIVVGGHIANAPQIESLIDADHICRGEGVRWFRRFLGLDEEAPIRHPRVYSGMGTRILGVNAPGKKGDTAAMLIPSVGCPVGCNFCSTSALFGGKGHHIDFFETGDELFEVMDGIARDLGVRSFFVMDENFLLHRKRALRLLELMQSHHKSWSLFVFSSARVLNNYSMEQLIRLGISWVWMGLEGEDSRYSKLNGVDTHELVARLQSNGIRVLGSTIIGLEEHTPENIDSVIDYAVSHATVFHQFMLYTPVPGTPLYAEHARDGSLLDKEEFPWADAHGQYRFNYRHRHIPPGEESTYLLRAFQRDFAVNGPSLARMNRTTLAGWERYRNHPDACVRERFDWEVQSLRSTYAAAQWGMNRWFRSDPQIHAQTNATLAGIYRAFGWKTRVIAAIGGRYVLRAIAREEACLERGLTFEPPTYYEKNPRARELEQRAACATKVPRAQERVAPAAGVATL